MNILTICGSLRAASLNAMLLHAIRRLAPPDMLIQEFAGMADLPLFNPDLDACPPASVINFKQQIASADVVLIASPEYAHGITGVLKNALDWTVSSDVFVNKPVVVLNASPRAIHADAALREILTVMSAQIIEAASVTVAVIGGGLDEDGIVAHPAIALQLQAALAAMGDYYRLQQLGQPALS
ncbi:NAD(P)H-dependent oxidoreductase [Undibacterium sp. CY18W]|uniref:NAD(P)H-dependent oxidoreductase n=1 Tax=Undibacterium hunanense TaxID=2762292 RepID=A0ABR6ZXZ0_9BURK|nr:NADPH-dependent FMN reductase [Undibacterium hunanense]MBC3920445.1 NAD(P)H-dependent oxidoreductase [Undibacterium hunanense]